MKRLMSIDITTDKNNVDWDEDAFVVKRISENLIHMGQELAADFEQVREKASIPASYYWIQGALFIGCAVFHILSADDKGSIFRLISNGFFVSLFAFWIYYRVRWNRATKGSMAKSYTERNNRFLELVKKELEYPETYYVMDVIEYNYEIENNETQTKDKKIPDGYFGNTEMAVYVEDHILYFANWNEKLGIPVEAIGSIREVYEEGTLDGWNKEVPYNAEEFLQYDMKEDITLDILIHSHCVVPIQHEGEQYELLIPAYEKEQLEKILQR